MYYLKKQLHDLVHPLEDLRESSKLTQMELAKRTGLTRTIIGRFERGLQIPNYDEATQLGNHFNLQWWRVVELCIVHRDRRDRLILRFKMSESSTDSHVCTDQEKKRCGTK